MASGHIDLTGERFGRLVALSLVPRKAGEQTRWLCACDCGNKLKIFRGSLTRGRSMSCGCYHRDRVTTHGMKNSPEWRAWISFRNRCSNPNNHQYSDYGGRGISVSPLWQNDFERFLKDVGRKPNSSLSLDRINNDGNYEPGNCRWATDRDQMLNRRKNLQKATDEQFRKEAERRGYNLTKI